MKLDFLETDILRCSPRIQVHIAEYTSSASSFETSTTREQSWFSSDGAAELQRIGKAICDGLELSSEPIVSLERHRRDGDETTNLKAGLRTWLNDQSLHLEVQRFVEYPRIDTNGLQDQWCQGGRECSDELVDNCGNKRPVVAEAGHPC